MLCINLILLLFRSSVSNVLSPFFRSFEINFIVLCGSLEGQFVRRRDRFVPTNVRAYVCMGTYILYVWSIDGR